MKKLLVTVVASAALVALFVLAWNRFATPEPDVIAAEAEVPVHVSEIIRTTMRGYITAYGAIVPEPAGQHPAAIARLASAVPGVIVAVRAAEGQRVEKGSVLFELDSRAADIGVTFARKTRERENQLMQTGGTSLKSLQQAEQQLNDALVQQALLKITSPLAGTVTLVNVAPGEAVDLTTILAEVVDLDRIVVSANIPVAEVASLEPGQVTEIVTGESDKPFLGELIYVGAGVDHATGAVPVRASLPAASGLRPGQFVGLRIVSAEHKDSLVVPDASIARDDEGLTVVAVVRNDRAVHIRVTEGLRDRGLVEINGDGLQPGMLVVTEGAYALPNNSRVRVIVD